MIFTWTIENFETLNTSKLYSDIFIAGGCKWRILIFPKGNNVDYISLYLDHVEDSGTLSVGWSRTASFSFVLVNQICSTDSTGKDTQHKFSETESDWGFINFIPLAEFWNPSKGYVVNDRVIIETEVAVLEVGCTIFPPAIMKTSNPQELAKNSEETILPEAETNETTSLTISSPTSQSQAEPTPPKEAAQVSLESKTSDFGNGTVGMEIVKQMEDLNGPSLKDDLTLRRLFAAEELLKSTSASEPSAEALTALDILSFYARSSLAALCEGGAYEKFTSALKLLTEQGMIPSTITSVLKDILESLERELPKYAAAEKKLAQGDKEFAGQHKDLKAQMELAMKKCQESKVIVTSYDAKVTQLETELARVKAKRAEAMENLRTLVDEMEPLRQSFVDNSSKSESFIVKKAKLTVQKGASLGSWIVVKDVLKNYLKLE